jgi:Rrf2 family nitric oxide-sensitive transcriptional repressor
MQLTRFTDLGFRVLMYLAQHDAPAPVTNAEIAALFCVPHNHLVKVVNRLAKLGWVDTQRGRNGGLRLAVNPAELRLGQVLRMLEEAEQLVDCASPPCVLKNRCLLKGAFDDALESFYRTLDERTLADVVKSRTRTALLTLHKKHAASTR